jgi:hypothetical protein
MGQRLKIAPFYPDAKCRIVMLDGEVPQGLGFGRFLATYNDPEISQIWTSDPIKLLAYCLKTCSIHFGRYFLAYVRDNVTEFNNSKSHRRTSPGYP